MTIRQCQRDHGNRSSRAGTSVLINASPDPGVATRLTHPSTRQHDVPILAYAPAGTDRLHCSGCCSMTPSTPAEPKLRAGHPLTDEGGTGCVYPEWLDPCPRLAALHHCGVCPDSPGGNLTDSRPVGAPLTVQQPVNVRT
ncbi:hypothetical protein GCM10010430_57110 [Kitasatospora cystarginea]|uniref:Uncharacterized protein n=1 Tax=Kitasatospora cystarginea TaxID=58350 RepID=A0ABN3EP91_9ACTN